MRQKLNVIDLFAGCGGLSEGFMQQGDFNFLAHVEWEKPMVDTLRENLSSRWGYTNDKSKESVIRFDIQKIDELLHGGWSAETRSEYAHDNSEKFLLEGLDGIIDGQKVDVVIGGPPCQAYSIAGRAQDKNSMKDDYRNYLFESFVKVVDYYKPRVFVFENVPGMLSAKPGDKLVIERVYEAFDKIGYEIKKPDGMKSAIYSAADYSVPQNRRRVILFGVMKNAGVRVDDLYACLNDVKCEQKKSVYDAIGGLPEFKPLKEAYKSGRRNVSHEQLSNEVVDHHNARYHNLRDIQVFKDWLGNDMNKIPHKEKLSYYKRVSGKDSNHNKYRSLEWEKPSPTIVSHLYKDGLMFIHPDKNQLRSITVKEASLLQSFPSDYKFVGSEAYCFKMIGNAVPVLFAKHIAQALVNAIKEK